MPQALSIYQKAPPAAFCGTRLEFVARYDLGLTFPHQLVTHRFYYVTASIVSTLSAPRNHDQTPRRPLGLGLQHSRRRHAARKRAREASSGQMARRREQELGICAKGIPNTPQGTVKISAFMHTVGEFYFVVRLHKYPTAWHLGNYEASEVIATLQTDSIKVTESGLDIFSPHQIEFEWECVTLVDSFVSSDPGTWDVEGDESDGEVFH